jgi:two-component system sensor histidine kinase KdpD
MPDGRPDPDALLALAGTGTRGRLTIFLGAAPGVGKTFAMLTRARGLKSAGIDVVIGLVETHGRSETAALLEGLEVLPRRRVDYKGRMLEELDLDAALTRRPAVLVVDEMAHSNAEGSRHPKRWQDIEELVAAGIDVWTALNIQHLESLSDLVAQISGVEVREIVPDVALKRADEVILVDVLPAELVQRLKEGKIYLPDNARRAIDGFFRPQNLTALRELALRRTADRVDDQMVDLLRQGAIEGPWATAERLLVLVGPDALSEKVVRTASRLASGLNAPWIVVSLVRTGYEPDAAGAQRLDETLRLAERLGAQTRRVTAEDFVAETLRIARRENITQIVVGRPKRSWHYGFTRRSLPDTLLRQSREVSVHIVSGDEQPQNQPGWSLRGRSARRWLETLALPLVAVAAITFVGLALYAALPLANLSMLYLVAVVVCGVISGRLSAVIAAAFSFLAYNFFFIEPVHTFTVASPHELFALVIFLAAAIFTGDLTGRIREQAERSRRQERATQALYDFSRKLSGAARLDTVLDATAAHLYAATGHGAAALTVEEGDLTLGAAWPPDLTLDATDMTAARWAHEKNEPAGNATGTLPQAPWQFRPITQGRTVVGVMGLRLDDGPPLLPAEEQMVRGVLEQAAVAIDRARLVKENARTAALAESEKLHAALFASLSHDLKTPLATITGAATSLRELGEKMDGPTRIDLLTSIEEEAVRLGRFVSNLFDMTRIEAGTLKPRLGPVDVGDLVNDAVLRVRKLHAGHEFEISLATELPPVRADQHLLGQALFNLLDNACKYGGDRPVTIFARPENGQIAIAVSDQGAGIPAKDLERVFEKFHRQSRGDGRAPGTGLGLSIARGFVEAMGGTFKAESPAVRKRGTRFTIRLPAVTVAA